MLPTESRRGRQDFQRAWEKLNDGVIDRAKMVRSAGYDGELQMG